MVDDPQRAKAFKLYNAANYQEAAALMSKVMANLKPGSEDWRKQIRFQTLILCVGEMFKEALPWAQ